MRLSELMSNMGDAFWPQVGLVMFIAMFVVIVVRTFSKRRKQDQDEASRLPLEDDSEHTEAKGHGFF